MKATPKQISIKEITNPYEAAIARLRKSGRKAGAPAKESEAPSDREKRVMRAFNVTQAGARHILAGKE